MFKEDFRVHQDSLLSKYQFIIFGGVIILYFLMIAVLFRMCFKDRVNKILKKFTNVMLWNGILRIV